MVWPLIAAGVQLGVGIMGSNAAKKAAKKAAKSQMALTRLQRDEEIRQKRLQAGYESSAATAGVYASNLMMSGTQQSYIGALDYENMREIAFAEKAADLEQKAIRAGAKGAGDSILYSAVGSALSTAILSFGDKAAAPQITPGGSG